MKVNRAYRTELDPNNKQRTMLLKSAGTARFAYNWGLDQRKRAYESTGRSLNAIELHRMLNNRKGEEFPWMYEVSKCAPQEALRDLDAAYKAFFEGRGRYPRFKSKRNGIGSFRLTGAIRVSDTYVQLPRIGKVRLKEHGYIPSVDDTVHILSVTVSEKAGRWFVSVSVEEEIDVPTNAGPVVGVDLGVARMATVSDGTVFEAPKALKRNERKLRRLQKSVSRKQKGSNNRRKAVQRLAKQHMRVGDIRKDAIHKTTTALMRTKSVVVIEDLNVSGMMKNHRLARSIGDAGMAEFRRQAVYKSEWYGSEIVVADRFYPSSKRCSRCSAVKSDLTLADRTFECPVCEFTIDRDLNAALNLEQLAASSAERVNACPSGRKTEVPMTLRQTAMKQEVNAIYSPSGIDG